jgi:hypothetical protein
MTRLYIENLQITPKEVVFVRWSKDNQIIKTNGYRPTSQSLQRLINLTFKYTFPGVLVSTNDEITAILRRPLNSEMEGEK